jgi:flagellar motility protein MotE (MotC chaperone)
MLFVRVDNIYAASKEIAAESGKKVESEKPANKPSDKPAENKTEHSAEDKPAAEEVPKPAEASADAGAGGDKLPEQGHVAEKTSDPLLFNDSELDILQSLSARRDQLDVRERQIEQKEGLLQVTEQRIDQKLAELKTLKGELEAAKMELDKLSKSLDDKQNEKLSGLVKTYESMKPKDAARIFDQLEMPVLISLIGQMKDAKMGPILASMDPAKAKSVTTELARRKMSGTPSVSESAPKMTAPAAPETKKQ